MERMLREDNERMLKTITEQFSQSAIGNKEKETFPSQPKTNPKGGTSFSSTSNSFRKINTIITLKSGEEIDNHVGDNSNEIPNVAPTTTTDDSGESKEDEPTITMTQLLLRLLLTLPCKFSNL